MAVREQKVTFVNVHCANSNGTLEFCSHIAAIIYYLSHAGYMAHITNFAEILNKTFNVKRVNSVINVDSDED